LILSVLSLLIYSPLPCSFFFFFNDTAPTELYTLSHTTLFRSLAVYHREPHRFTDPDIRAGRVLANLMAAAMTTMELAEEQRHRRDRKSTRLNSSHLGISYAVFCLKKKKKKKNNKQEDKIIKYK